MTQKSAQAVTSRVVSFYFVFLPPGISERKFIPYLFRAFAGRKKMDGYEESEDHRKSVLRCALRVAA
jgi:hypothetical protein